VNKTNKFLATAVLALSIGALSPSITAASQPHAPADVAAVKQFETAIANYMAMRQKLRSEVRGPVKDSSSTQLTNASDALAGAIERSRQGAQVGTIFTPPVAIVIKRRIADAIRTQELAPVLADIDDEGTSGPAPKVHLRLPVTAQMATMPPALLKVLPALPKELEYRILGKYLVLRDVDASLILDYIPAAVAR
jgi:hypothetical protein